MLYYTISKYVGLILQYKCEEIMNKDTKVKDEKDYWYLALEYTSFFAPILSLLGVLIFGLCHKDDSIIVIKLLFSLIPFLVGILTFINILSNNGDYLEASFNELTKQNQDEHSPFFGAVKLILKRHPIEKSKKVFASIVSSTAVFVSIDKNYILYSTYMAFTIIVYVVPYYQIVKMYKRIERSLIEYLICFYFILANIVTPIILIVLAFFQKNINWLCFAILYSLVIVAIIIIFGLAYIFGPKREEKRSIEENKKRLEEAEEKKKKNADFNRLNNLKKKRKKHRPNKTKYKKGKR